MLVVKNFLLCQEQINLYFISIVTKLDSTADNKILCMYFTVTSPPVVESNINCSHWSCTSHLDFGQVSNLGLNVRFSSSYTGSLPCEVLQLNTVCSTPQSKQQSHLPFKYNSLLTSSKGSISGQKHLWKAVLLVFIMIPTQRLFKRLSSQFLVPGPGS